MDLISVTFEKGLQCSISVRGHELLSDMPASEDGDDLGPRPTEMLVSAAGACIGMAISRYCQTIGCSPKGLELYLTYQMTGNPARIEAIVIDLELPETFPKNRKPALRRIIDGCPVLSTLENPPRIDLEVA